jgi:hypothetical protein
MPPTGGGGGGGGAVKGSHTVKRGSGAGNYSNATTSFAAIDSTNLDLTVTVPVGMLAICLCVGSATAIGAALTNGGYIAIFVDSVQMFTDILSANASAMAEPFALSAVVVGDGASHVFSPQFAAAAASHTTFVYNDAATDAPFNLVLLVSAT